MILRCIMLYLEMRLLRLNTLCMINNTFKLVFFLLQRYKKKIWKPTFKNWFTVISFSIRLSVIWNLHESWNRCSRYEQTGSILSNSLLLRIDYVKERKRTSLAWKWSILHSGHYVNVSFANLTVNLLSCYRRNVFRNCHCSRISAMDLFWWRGDLTKHGGCSPEAFPTSWPGAEYRTIPPEAIQYLCLQSTVNVPPQSATPQIQEEIKSRCCRWVHQGCELGEDASVFCQNHHVPSRPILDSSWKRTENHRWWLQIYLQKGESSENFIVAY